MTFKWLNSWSRTDPHRSECSAGGHPWIPPLCPDTPEQARAPKGPPLTHSDSEVAPLLRQGLRVYTQPLGLPNAHPWLLSMISFGVKEGEMLLRSFHS